MTARNNSELCLTLGNANNQVKIGSIYCHYRDPSQHYIVIDIVLNESDEKPMIIYQALYGDKLKWARYLDIWNQFVVHNGKNVPRFTEVSTSS